MSSERRVVLLLPASVGLLVLAFTAATAIAEYRVRDVEEDARLIYDNAVPAMDYLSAARTGVRELEETLTAQLVAHGPPASMANRTPQAAFEAREKMERSWAAYAALPASEEERSTWPRAVALQAQVSASLERLNLDLQGGDLPAAREEVTQMQMPLAQLDALLGAAAASEGAKAKALGEDIFQSNLWSRRLAVGLDLLCVLLAVAVAVLMARNTREHLAALNRRMSELELFSSRVAHDVRSPLAAVGLAIDLAQRIQDDPPRLRRTLERAGQAVRRMGELVEGLLMLARLGGALPVPGQSRVSAAVAAMLSELLPMAEAKEIDLVAERIDDCEVACTSGVLASLLANLVGNAIKYMGASPVRRVEVTAKDLGQSVRFEVKDSGPGVPAAARERIFEPYARAADVSIPGLGMGLATVRKLAEAYGGEAGLVPQSEGSLFWFQLPKAEERSGPIARAR